MAEWYRDTSTVQRIGRIMAHEFKAAACCGGTGTGEGGAGAGERTPGAVAGLGERPGASGRAKSLFGFAINALQKPLKTVANLLGGQAMRMWVTDFAGAMRKGTDAADAWALQVNALELGTTYDNLTNLSKEFRNLQLTVEGSEKGMGNLVNVMRKNVNEFVDFTGDFDSATQAIAKQMDIFGRTGLNPNLDLLKKSSKEQARFGKSIFDSMKDLQKLGVSFEEAQEIQKRFMENTGVQQRLRGKQNKQERLQVMRGLMAREREWKMLGMSADQARNAAEALEAIAGKGPKQRMKEAARLQAMLGAMGVEGADEAANILRLGRRATTEQQDRFREIMGTAQDTFAGIQQAGLGVEMTFGTMMDKLDLGQYFGPESPFSTSLTKGIKVNDATVESMRTLSESANQTSETIKLVNKAVQRFGNVVDRNLAFSMGKAFGGAGALLVDYMGTVNNAENRQARAADALFANMTDIGGQMANIVKNEDFQKNMEDSALYKIYDFSKSIVHTVQDIGSTLVEIKNKISNSWFFKGPGKEVEKVRTELRSKENNELLDLIAKAQIESKKSNDEIIKTLKNTSLTKEEQKQMADEAREKTDRIIKEGIHEAARRYYEPGQAQFMLEKARIEHLKQQSNLTPSGQPTS
jgi:hypothetical protein